ncbi:hypothetical protein KY342_03590 [Candidatus Woesearchaeota archaeon]|nr:hypothetical protein [Candidatus Woesearchaeota archaeon]
MKKKSELTFNMIIAAVLALVVLSVLVYFLMSRTALFKKGIGDCEAKGGKCEASCPKERPISAFKGCYVGSEYKEDYNCCVKIG